MMGLIEEEYGYILDRSEPKHRYGCIYIIDVLISLKGRNHIATLTQGEVDFRDILLELSNIGVEEEILQRLDKIVRLLELEAVDDYVQVTH